MSDEVDEPASLEPTDWHAKMHERVERDFTNHPPRALAVEDLLSEVSRRCVDLAHWILDNVPSGREQSTALTKLEETSMHAKAGIARLQHRVPGGPDR